MLYWLEELTRAYRGVQLWWHSIQRCCFRRPNRRRTHQRGSCKDLQRKGITNHDIAAKPRKYRTWGIEKESRGWRVRVTKGNRTFELFLKEKASLGRHQRTMRRITEKGAKGREPKSSERLWNETENSKSLHFTIIYRENKWNGNTKSKKRKRELVPFPVIWYDMIWYDDTIRYVAYAMLWVRVGSSICSGPFTFGGCGCVQAGMYFLQARFFFFFFFLLF